jgi:hypothetical protein
MIRIRDHRGRRVPVRRIGNGRLWAMLAHSATTAGSAVAGLGAVAFVAWFTYRLGITGGEPGPGPFGLFDLGGSWVVALFIAAFLLWVPLLLSILRSSFLDELSAGKLLIQQCGACGYELGGTATERDGCRVCPECGAAWRLANDETGRT